MAEILGMGNALVDLMTKIDRDEVLEQLQLPKGSMQLVDAEVSNQVAVETEQFPKMRASGGSAANTIHGLSRLGASTAFVGTIGQDDTGDFFRKDMEEAGIQAVLFRSETPSGLAIALVTPDGERTFATHLGAAIELSADHLKEEHFFGHQYFYVEGYLVQNEALLIKAMELAKRAGLTIALDLASYNVVEAKKEFLRKILREYIDIVFANEEEAFAISGLEPKKALDFLGDMCAYAVVKVGAKGALIKHNNEYVQVPAIQVNAIDTTGAGDMFAAGFLYALLKGMALEEAGKAGAILAGNVIEVMGAKMDQNKWKQVHSMLSLLKKENNS